MYEYELSDTTDDRDDAKELPQRAALVEESSGSQRVIVEKPSRSVTVAATDSETRNVEVYQVPLEQANRFLQSIRHPRRVYTQTLKEDSYIEFEIAAETEVEVLEYHTERLRVLIESVPRTSGVPEPLSDRRALSVCLVLLVLFVVFGVPIIMIHRALI